MNGIEDFQTISLTLPLTVSYGLKLNFSFFRMILDTHTPYTHNSRRSFENSQHFFILILGTITYTREVMKVHF